MIGRASPLTLFSISLSSLAIAMATFWLAWSPTPRFVATVLPGAYIAATVNKLLKLPGSGAGVWILFFASHVLFWFAFLSACAWVVLAVRSRWRDGKASR